MVNNGRKELHGKPRGSFTLHIWPAIVLFRSFIIMINFYSYSTFKKKVQKQETQEDNNTE